jgi:biopolymer transport protein ExbB/TolQ
MLQTIVKMFNDGGTFMWVILAVMAVSIAIMLERIIYLFIYCRGNSYNVVNNVLSAIESGKSEQARNLLSKKTSPVFVLIRTAVDRYLSGAKTDRILDGVEKAAIHQVPRISKRINYLSLLANISTLMGLLGTILGLQTSFGSMAAADLTQKSIMLASGTAEAMNTTAFGLIVAISCMVMYTLLHNREQSLIKEIDEGVAHFIDTIKERE